MDSSRTIDPTRDLWFLGTLMRLHVRAVDSDGRFTVVEQRTRAGFAPPRHMHATEDAILYVIEGRLTVDVGGETSVLGPGHAVFLPRGVPHSYRADAPTRLLEISSPGGIDRFYAQNGEPAATLDLPPPASTDIGALTQSARTFALTILGPPMGAD